MIGKNLLYYFEHNDLGDTEELGFKNWWRNI